MLERALPEIAAAIYRRRADVQNHDPLAAFRFRVAERLDDAKVMVYSARIATSEHSIQDRFTISDRRGRKLDDSSIEQARRALTGSGR